MCGKWLFICDALEHAGKLGWRDLAQITSLRRPLFDAGSASEPKHLGFKRAVTQLIFYDDLAGTLETLIVVVTSDHAFELYGLKILPTKLPSKRK